jgi:methyltransferase-like protein
VPPSNPNALETFLQQNGREFTLNDPALKTVFHSLWNAWPNTMTTTELFEILTNKFGSAWSPTNKTARDSMAATLLKCYLNRTVDLCTFSPKLSKELSAKPIVSPLARYTAQTSSNVSTHRHMVAQLSNLDRYILCHLDGNHTRDQVLAEVEAALAKKLFAAPERPVAEAVDESLDRIAFCGLLVG